MKKTITKNLSKQIICIIIILMLCNFILPNYSYSVSTEGGGSLLNTFASLFCIIPDTIMGFLQDMFVSPARLQEYEGEEYKILYSPATIFAGKIPAFSINFINQEKELENVTIDETLHLIDGEGTTWKLTNEEFWERYSSYNYIGDLIEDLVKDGRAIGTDGKGIVLAGSKNFNPDYVDQISENGSGRIKLSDLVDQFGITWIEGESYVDDAGSEQYEDNYDSYIVDYVAEKKINLYNVEYDGVKYETLEINYNSINATAGDHAGNYLYKITGHYGNFEIEKLDDNGDNKIETVSYEDMEIVVEHSDGTAPLTTKDYYYTSYILQPIISTWYKAFRRIALVGLLSVIVYVGIRILLSSTSSQDKAKYKSMLKNWFMALCILFTLHYLMSIIIVIVDRISQTFQVSMIGADGEDVLMSTIRNQIASGDTWGEVLPYIVFYFMLMIYTIIFTIQYIRRVIYIAFLTAIAPLITLTYPLDKIKDGKAQAFDMWTRDYIFFSLLQVMHLLLYYVLVGSAVDLTKQGNWLYAVVAIGFITPAEKIIKKMFGFEKSKSMGALAAGATGALVTNAINKISGKHFGGTKSPQHQEVRMNNHASTQTTLNVDPLDAMIEQESSNERIQSNNNGNLTNNTEKEKVSTNSIARGKNTTLNKMSNKIPSSNNAENKGKELIGGAKSLLGKYGKSTFNGAAKGAAGILLGGTGALIGGAAGLAQGDLGAAATGLVAGGAAGKSIGEGAVNAIDRGVKGLKKSVDSVSDAWKEASIGKEAAQNLKNYREFKQSVAYKELQRTYKEDRNFDKKIEQMIDNGIKDPNKMKKILMNNKKHPRKYKMDMAIAYHTLAETCPDGVLFNNKKFIRFCQDKDLTIAEEELKNLRKCIIDFK